MARKYKIRSPFRVSPGSPHTDTKRNGTFDQLFPSDRNAFGLTDSLGFQNIKEEKVNLDLTPPRHLTVLIQQEWLRLTLRLTGRLSRNTPNSSGQKAGGWTSKGNQQ